MKPSNSDGKSSDNGGTPGSPDTGPDELTGSRNRFLDWILIEGDRLLIASLIVIATFVGFLLLNEIGVIAFVNDDSITRLAGGMIAGALSLVTLVVSINQLIISREFVAAAEFEEQLEGILSFRDDVADLAAVPTSPASPARIFELLAAAIDDRAGKLSTSVADHDEEVRTQMEPFTSRVRTSAAEIDDALEHTSYGTFQAVSVAIRYEDARQLYIARRLHKRYVDRLSPVARESLEELIEALKLFSVAREQFKTTYLQRELTRFSQLTIYCGVPAVLAAMVIGLLYADVGGASIRPDALPYVVSGLVGVVVSPLALLASFILRTATITRRTASVGPMLPRKGPDEGSLDVTYGEEAPTKSGGDLLTDE